MLLRKGYIGDWFFPELGFVGQTTVNDMYVEDFRTDLFVILVILSWVEVVHVYLVTDLRLGTGIHCCLPVVTSVSPQII